MFYSSRTKKGSDKEVKFSTVFGFPFKKVIGRKKSEFVVFGKEGKFFLLVTFFWTSPSATFFFHFQSKNLLRRRWTSPGNGESRRDSDKNMLLRRLLFVSFFSNIWQKVIFRSKLFAKKPPALFFVWQQPLDTKEALHRFFSFLSKWPKNIEVDPEWFFQKQCEWCDTK